MEGLTVSEKGAGRGGGKGWGSCREGPPNRDRDCGGCLLGADWRDGQNPTDISPPHPKKRHPEILPRDGVGSRGKAGQVFEKLKA